jgi:succinate dehydrogenase / fumarate reductase flavoprotein subunit
MRQSDVLVIGAGGAGLSAALHAKKSGADVLVLTKEYPTRSQTCMAQGGINAALGNVSDDSVKDHIANTLKSAHGIANKKAIEFLCSNAIDAVNWLDEIGVCFSRTKDAKIAQRTLGGASAPRACYAQDYTGLKMLHTLYDKTLEAGIEVLNEKYLLDLVVEDGVAYGANVLDLRSGEIEVYEAKSIILATGGYSRIYGKHSTNSTASSGDGIAAALRAGANVSDMEFIQFHPTALKNSSILISESARGAGGYLLDSKGNRFTDELLPRDEVARAIYDQIQNGEDIFLDIRHLGEEFIDEELPQERKLAKLYENIDPVNDIIPIKPSAHYTMGGIVVDDNSQTSINGLYAVGECANHRVHGANRLGGNSLLELVVFGIEAGVNATEYSKDISFKGITQDRYNQIDEVMSYKSKISFYDIKDELADVLYNKLGIKRDKVNLESALTIIEDYISKLNLMGVEDKSKKYNTNLVEFLEFKNMLELSRISVLCAIDRKESRGAHFRDDMPYEDEKYARHTVVNKDGVFYED